MLEACRTHKTAERDVATAWLVEHALGADAEQRRRHEGWLRLVRARREVALEELAAERDRGRIAPAPLDAADRRALASALCEHAAVGEAWLFGQDIRVQDVDYRAAVLLLRVHPQRLTDQGLDEEHLAELARELLAWVFLPGQLRLVLTRYTTEGLPPKLAEALAANASTRLF